MAIFGIDSSIQKHLPSCVRRNLLVLSERRFSWKQNKVVLLSLWIKWFLLSFDEGRSVWTWKHLDSFQNQVGPCEVGLQWLLLNLKTLCLLLRTLNRASNLEQSNSLKTLPNSEMGIFFLTRKWESYSWLGTGNLLPNSELVIFITRNWVSSS